MLYDKLFIKGKKKFAVLIDPEKSDLLQIAKTAEKAELSKADMIFIGGSLVSRDLSESVKVIKNNCNLPVFLFPGSVFQITDEADAILLLSLISGRNPDYLIGNHVIAAPYLKKTSLEVIPVGYILINGSGTTSVEYISNTKPIPPDKPDIVVATALAGEMTGQKVIYLEAGSGAEFHVPANVIQDVRMNIKLPLIVGGGIRTIETAEKIYKAGADIIVIGNILETDPDLIKSFARLAQSFV